MELNKLLKKAGKLQSRFDHAKRQVTEEKEALERIAQRLAAEQEAQVVIQKVAQMVQESAHRQIVSVVTKCLRAVFGPDTPEFKIIFEKKRGKTEARLVFVNEDGVEMDPTFDRGGGILDVAALALRISCIILSKPPVRPVLVMDEPCKNVNGEGYQSKVGGMLEALAKEMDVQLIIVTDDDWLKIGKVINLEENQ